MFKHYPCSDTLITNSCSEDCSDELPFQEYNITALISFYYRRMKDGRKLSPWTNCLTSDHTFSLFSKLRSVFVSRIYKCGRDPVQGNLITSFHLGLRCTSSIGWKISVSIFRCSLSSFILSLSFQTQTKSSVLFWLVITNQCKHMFLNITENAL